MELESDLAKELFNKVIVPLQTKNKEKEITVQNEYKRNQEQFENERIVQQIAESKRLAAIQGVKAIAAEKAKRMEFEKEQRKLEKVETDRMTREAAEKEEADRMTREAAEKEEADRMAREEADRMAREEAERVDQEAVAITNIDQATVDDNIPPAVSKENIYFNLQGQLPPTPPTIETCKANERDIIPSEDCNPNTHKPKPRSWLRFHPDKNANCEDIATEKFKKLTTACEEYTPSSTTSEPTDVPTTSEPTDVPTTSEPSDVPTTSEPSGPAISTDMLALPAPGTASIDVGEYIQEPLIQNKFDVNKLIQILTTALNTDTSLNTEQVPTDVKVDTHNALILNDEDNYNGKITAQEIVSGKDDNESDITKAETEHISNFDMNQLINTLNQSLVKSVPAVEPKVSVGSPEQNIDQQNEATEQMYISDLDKALEEEKKKQRENATSSPEPEPVPMPEPTQVPAPTSVPIPDPVSATTESFDWKGKLDWLKQSVGLLISSLSNMFTFKPAEDNDPYKLSPERENEGYIYIGKMYMKDEDETSPSKQVKYVNYHPDKKDFYIDERPEVVT